MGGLQGRFENSFGTCYFWSDGSFRMKTGGIRPNLFMTTPGMAPGFTMNPSFNYQGRYDLVQGFIEFTDGSRATLALHPSGNVIVNGRVYAFASPTP